MIIIIPVNESATPFLLFLTRNENIGPHRDLHMYVHSCFVYDSPELETTQIFIDWLAKKGKKPGLP